MVFPRKRSKVPQAQVSDSGTITAAPKFVDIFRNDELLQYAARTVTENNFTILVVVSSFCLALSLGVLYRAGGDSETLNKSVFRALLCDSRGRTKPQMLEFHDFVVQTMTRSVPKFNFTIEVGAILFNISHVLSQQIAFQYDAFDWKTMYGPECSSAGRLLAADFPMPVMWTYIELHPDTMNIGGVYWSSLQEILAQWSLALLAIALFLSLQGLLFSSNIFVQATTAGLEAYIIYGGVVFAVSAVCLAAGLTLFFIANGISVVISSSHASSIQYHIFISTVVFGCPVFITLVGGLLTQCNVERQGKAEVWKRNSSFNIEPQGTLEPVPDSDGQSKSPNIEPHVNVMV